MSSVSASEVPLGGDLAGFGGQTLLIHFCGASSMVCTVFCVFLKRLLVVVVVVEAGEGIFVRVLDLSLIHISEPTRPP